MENLVYIIAQAYRGSLLMFFNVVFNGAYYIYFLFTGKLFKYLKKKKILRMEAKDFEHIKLMYSQFKYKYDGLFKTGTFGEKSFLRWLEKWPTWTQGMLVNIHKDFNGNCQDAAHLAKWLCKQYNKKVKVIGFGQKIYTDLKIYVPTELPEMFTKVHYFVTIKYYGIQYQFDNGKIKRENDKQIAVSRLGEDLNFIWL